MCDHLDEGRVFRTSTYFSGNPVNQDPPALWDAGVKIAQDRRGNWAQGASMFVLRLMCILFVNCLLSAPPREAQVPTEHPELIAGPWEVASASRIDGIFFAIVTSSSGQTGREQFDWQTMNIRVYHREGGKETCGYFATNDKASAQSYSLQDDHSFTLFDGERLRIHCIELTGLKPFASPFRQLPTSGREHGRAQAKSCTWC